MPNQLRPNFDHPIIDEVANLEMPRPNGVIINHGAALVIWGIRSEHADGDIDAMISQPNVEHVRNELGWRAVDMFVGVSDMGEVRDVKSYRDDENRFDFHHWDFSMFRYQMIGKGRILQNEARRYSVKDPRTGIRVATPEYVRFTKIATGREKDYQDIRRIDETLGI